MDGEVTFDDPRTDLDSHANMPVVGRNSNIIERLDRTVDIKPFTSDYKAMTAELVHSAIWYECPYEGKAYILVTRNAIYIPTMVNNLIPLLMMREAGINVNERAHTQLTQPWMTIPLYSH